MTVSGETLSGDYKFDNSKRVSVKKISDLTFIETDKPVYKPGQKGIEIKRIIDYNIYFDNLILSFSRLKLS